MDSVEICTAVKIFDRKIWVESDFMGNKHVMIQHDDGDSDPFCYCSFYYDYRHTSNSTIKDLAEKIAIDLGAEYPIEYRSRALCI